MQAIDFRKAHWIPENDAAWHLQWSPEDLSSPFLAAVKLYVNTSHPRMSQAIETMDTTVLSALYHDVGRRLIIGTLSRSDWPDSPDKLEDTALGRVVWRLIQSCFPGQSLSIVTSQLRMDPDFFEARLQAALRLFHE